MDAWLGNIRDACFARLAALGLMTAALVGVSQTARADERPDIPVRVTETLHDGCPRSPTLLARVRARLPRVRPAAAGEAAVDVDVRVERRGGVSHGTVALVHGRERAERTASSASCDRVLAALAVMAAIGLDEKVTLETEAPSSASAPADDGAAPAGGEATRDGEAHGEPPRSTPVDAPGREVPVRDEPRPPGAPAIARAEDAPRFGVGIGTSLEASANRGAVVASSLAVQIALPLRFEPTIRVGLLRSFRREVVSSRGSAGLSWTTATAAGCADLFRNAALRAGPCVNLEVGAIEAVVLAPPPARGRVRPWLSAGASGRIAWRPLRALSFELAAGVRAPLVRSELFFEPITHVYEAPVAVPFIGTSAFAHLP